MKKWPLKVVAILILVSIIIGGCDNSKIQKEYTLSIAVNGHGITFPSARVGTYTYEKGRSVTVVTVADPNWRFDHWSGDKSGTGPTVVIKMNGNKSVTANFSRITHILTMAVNGNGTTDPPVGENTCDAGTVVNITATPADGWRFDHWSNYAANRKSPNTTVSMNFDKTITAIFSKVK